MGFPHVIEDLASARPQRDGWPTPDVPVFSADRADAAMGRCGIMVAVVSREARQKSKGPELPLQPFLCLASVAVQALATSPMSTLRPGPMVELKATFLTYLPLAPEGLALTMASMKASKL